MCNVLPGRLPGERMDPAPSFNWSHILGPKLPEIERGCAKECGGGYNTSAFKILIVLQEKFSWRKEFNPTDYQIKQLHNADKC